MQRKKKKFLDFILPIIQKIFGKKQKIHTPNDSHIEQPREVYFKNELCELMNDYSKGETIILIYDGTSFNFGPNYFNRIIERLYNSVQLKVLEKRFFNRESPYVELDMLIEKLLDKGVEVVLVTSGQFNGNTREPLDLFDKFKNLNFKYAQALNWLDDEDAFREKYGFSGFEKSDSRNLENFLQNLNLLKE